MDIGTQKPSRVVTPIQEPVPQRERRTAPAKPHRAPRRTPARTPAKTPTKTPAKT